MTIALWISLASTAIAFGALAFAWHTSRKQDRRERSQELDDMRSDIAYLKGRIDADARRLPK